MIYIVVGEAAHVRAAMLTYILGACSCSDVKHILIS